MPPFLPCITFTRVSHVAFLSRSSHVGFDRAAILTLSDWYDAPREIHETKADDYPELLTPNSIYLPTMAVESARSKSYFPMAMDSSFDMFYPVDVSPYAQTVDYSRLPQYYNDSTSTLFDSDIHKPSIFSSTPATPPSVSAHPDPQIPTGSAASGPSIASASSSAIGSPYSGHQVFQDQWVNTGHGLGLPAAVMPEFFPNEYAGGAVDIDGLYPEKLPCTHVGMCSIANLLRICANKKSKIPT